MLRAPDEHRKRVDNAGNDEVRYHLRRLNYMLTSRLKRKCQRQLPVCSLVWSFPRRMPLG